MSEVIDWSEVVSDGVKMKQAASAAQITEIPAAYRDMALLTFDEVAVLLKCKRRTIDNLASGGELRTVKIGSLSRVTVQDLQAFIDGLPLKS